jgi:hypothetical protein
MTISDLTPDPGQQPDPVVTPEPVPDPETERLRADLERERQEKAQLMEVIQQVQAGSGNAALQDPNTGLQLSAQQIQAAALDPEHPLHAFAQTQVALARAFAETRQEIQQFRREQAQQVEWQKIPDAHRAMVEKHMRDNPGLYGSPVVAFGYMKGMGLIKNTPQEIEAGAAAVGAGRAANAAGLPNPQPMASPQAAGPREMKRSDYLQQVRTNPTLRSDKDAGKLVLTD